MAAIATKGLEAKSLERPEEVRRFVDKGAISVVTVGGVTIGRGVFEPGWRWSQHVKPLAGTDSCQAAHLGYVLSGRMKIVMNDGAETELGPGDAFNIAPGHDAWTVGDEACVMVDVVGFAEYAKQK